MKVVFTTLHAKYVHASLALPYLAAATEDIAGIDAIIREFTVNEQIDGVLQQLVAEEADVVLFSCYIWNIEQIARLAENLKLIRPETFVVLGGPEASYGAFDLLQRHAALDCIIRGEGETTCRELLQALAAHYPGRPESGHLPGIVTRSGADVIAASGREPIATLDAIPSPFAAGLVDLGKPLVYYETSRGCPFSCAFCMSSLEQGVRTFSLERIRADLGLLMENGVPTVKLVDRTFNYDAGRANDIWDFILRHNRQSRFHFEIAADLLTDENLALLARVPDNTFRFEIGVQSKDERTLEQVGRKSDLEKLFANVVRLRHETAVTVHLDLVAGLPHEDAGGFLDSLQSLFELSPHHIQVEPLKVLKGSPMRKIADSQGYAYSATPPYKILQTPWLTYEEVCHIELVARLVDLFYNSGKFGTSLAILAEGTALSTVFSRAAGFWRRQAVALHLSQPGLFEILWQFGREFLPDSRHEVFREAICYDFCLADYPATGRLPACFNHNGTGADMPPKTQTGEIIRQLKVAEGSKVRTFRWIFAHDFRTRPCRPSPVDLLFVYVSSAGRGLHILIHEYNQPR